MKDWVLISWNIAISGDDEFKYSFILIILALIELTFHDEIFINYKEKDIPQPQDDLVFGFDILNDVPINSFT